LPALTIHAVEGDRYDALLRQLVAVAERGGLSVAFKDRLVWDANGVSYGDGRIELKEGNPAGNLCKTLVHEYVSWSRRIGARTLFKPSGARP